jgi:hypothetical protein
VLRALVLPGKFQVRCSFGPVQMHGEHSVAGAWLALVPV